ncbi:MAG TPA: bifunctional glutamate N-acetyltransferase/amino-acid acetyltransferase ArgJ [Solirubrobacteraceae bacterium]|nr:bifunctional glutamate N-acetyltransferase/amino-acid acetyltransferase ArgJ [Solirubrobacteraceae bacterium]
MSAAPSTFFRSRWVDAPMGAREAAGGLPDGFRAAGVAAGLKASGRPDVGLLVCDAQDATSAARFTRSGVVAAPVTICRQRARLDGLRAVAVNSGNANAATGGRGLDDAAKMQGAAAIAAGVPHDRVAVASTGVIGVPLDTEAIVSGLEQAAGRLRADGDADFTAAIMTTDAFEKRATLDIDLPGGGTVRLCAQAKGAGMIQPSFATMLCFVQTDAALSPDTADLLLGVTVKRSFDRITVDGQLSTNDTVLLMASGASGVEIAQETDDELAFGQALDSVLRQLAIEIVRDGEGSARVGRVVVTGGDGLAVERAARGVANSPLVKTALNGGDPNWGRIAQAVGGALMDTGPLPLDIVIEGVPVCRRGAAVPYELDALVPRVAREEVEYVVGLPGDGHETEVFFSDLSHGYVTINADYTT